MYKIFVVLLCSFLIFGCKVHKGYRVCKKDTNECLLLKSDKYFSSIDDFYFTTDNFCKVNAKATFEYRDGSNFKVYTCKDYDFYDYFEE